MKNRIRLYQKSVKISVVIAFAVIVSACKVTLVPEHDAEIAKQIETTSKKVDQFYLSMLDTTKEQDGGRAFDKFSKDYVMIEVELNSLINKNKIRPLNQHSIRICEITKKLWVKYKNEHKVDNTLSNGLIKLNQKTFSDLFFAMLKAEVALKIASENEKKLTP